MKFISFFVLVFVMTGVMAEKEYVPSALPETYCNPRFDYCFTYDASIFTKTPKAVNSRGVTLTDHSGTVFLDSYASLNPYKLSAATLLEDNLAYLIRNEASEPRRVKKHKDRDSYTFSFETDDAYFKQEMMLEGNSYQVLTVRIPVAQRAMIERITTSTRFVENPAVAVR